MSDGRVCEVSLDASLSADQCWYLQHLTHVPKFSASLSGIQQCPPGKADLADFSVPLNMLPISPTGFQISHNTLQGNGSIIYL